MGKTQIFLVYTQDYKYYIDIENLQIYDVCLKSRGGYRGGMIRSIIYASLLMALMRLTAGAIDSLYHPFATREGNIVILLLMHCISILVFISTTRRLKDYINFASPARLHKSDEKDILKRALLVDALRILIVFLLLWLLYSSITRFFYMSEILWSFYSALLFFALLFILKDVVDIPVRTRACLKLLKQHREGKD